MNTYRDGLWNLRWVLVAFVLACGVMLLEVKLGSAAEENAKLRDMCELRVSR